ncbi:MAG: hypothetical protein FWG13_01145 [Leptospirales bacterium]|nr:hypothetical protein [Leptospirales bacterium]
MVKKIPLLLAVVCLASPVFSFSLQELLGNESARNLIAASEITISDHTGMNLKIVPRHPALINLLNQNTQTLKPNIMVESLFLYTKPSSANKNAWSAEERLSVYNELVKLSTLTEVKYFSRTRNKTYTLYEFCSIIDDISAQNPLPDPTFKALPAKSSFYVRQKDVAFGYNVYSYIYETSASVFTVSQKNVFPFKRAGVTLLGKDELRSFAAIFDAGPYILLYGVVMVKADLLPGLKEPVLSSISNRVTAMLKWVAQRTDAAYKR